MTSDGDLLDELRAAYDRGAAYREGLTKPPWRLVERQSFLDRLRDCGSRRLLEVGAGAGHDSRFFADAGLTVVATDLSPAMVEYCRAKGLDADLAMALSTVAGVLRPHGLLYLGVWGGLDFEGQLDDDEHEPKRFFAFRTDEQLLDHASAHFTVLDFHTVTTQHRHHFQSLTLRRAD